MVAMSCEGDYFFVSAFIFQYSIIIFGKLRIKEWFFMHLRSSFSTEILSLKYILINDRFCYYLLYLYYFIRFLKLDATLNFYAKFFCIFICGIYARVIFHFLIFFICKNMSKIVDSSENIREGFQLSSNIKVWCSTIKL